MSAGPRSPVLAARLPTALLSGKINLMVPLATGTRAGQSTGNSTGNPKSSVWTCAARKVGRGFDLEIRLRAAAVAETLARCLSRWLMRSSGLFSLWWSCWSVAMCPRTPSCSFFAMRTRCCAARSIGCGTRPLTGCGCPRWPGSFPGAVGLRCSVSPRTLCCGGTAS